MFMRRCSELSRGDIHEGIQFNFCTGIQYTFMRGYKVHLHEFQEGAMYHGNTLNFNRGISCTRRGSLHFHESIHYTVQTLLGDTVHFYERIVILCIFMNGMPCFFMR